MEARESQVPQVEMSKEEQGGQCSWRNDMGERSIREIRAVVEGGHLKGFASGSEEMGILTGWWSQEQHKPISLVPC